MMRQTLLVLSAAILLSSCSSFRIAYNQADWYLVRQVSKYICPTPEQRAALARVADGFLRWHRRHELPRYATAFRRIAAALDRPVKKELLLETYGLIDHARERASRRLEPAIVALGLRLGETQARCLAAKIAMGQRKRLGELGGDEESYRRKHGEKVIDTFEDWVGSLSEKQRAVSRSMLDSQPTARAVAVARLNKGMRLVSAIRARDPKKKRRWLKSWVTDPFALYTVKERALMKRRHRERREQLWGLVRTLTAAQRKRFKEKLVAYARDFEVLSRAK
jgi:hypothetical protein